MIFAKCADVPHIKICSIVGIYSGVQCKCIDFQKPWIYPAYIFYQLEKLLK